jgi:signal transduction histidine kinase
LAIVQRIVARHGGEVWGRSQLNQGATFGFALPKHSGGTSHQGSERLEPVSIVGSP